MLGLNTRLAEQNQIKSWRPCEARGRAHTFQGHPHFVGGSTNSKSYTRRCSRCPVVILTVVR